MKFINITAVVSCVITLATSALADVDTYLDGFCSANTFNTEQCACTKTVFADQVTSRGLSDEETSMAALFLGQTGLDFEIFANAMQAVDRAVMPKVIPIVGQLQAPIYQTCVEVDANTFTATETEMGERYLQACIFVSGQDEDEKKLCECQRDAFASQFDDEAFLLITETTEIEASGEATNQDPLEYLLIEKRGLSQDEAMGLLMENQHLFLSVPPILHSCAQKVLGGDVDLQGLMEGITSGGADQ